MEFSQKVRLLRKKNRFTQTTFANAVGVSRQSVYKWEDGQAYPEVERLVKMRYIFNCSIDDLLDDGMSVSDDGTLKPNSVVEYENAHKKTRKPRKDKGIKTGIPPMRKNGEPVVRRKKPVEAPKEAAPAEPTYKIPERQNSLRTRTAPIYSNRDAAAAARAAIASRRLNRPRFSDEFSDDIDFSDDVDFNEGEYTDPRRAAMDRRQAPVAVQAPAPVAEEPKAPRVPKEKKKVASLINTEADGTQARKAAEEAAAAAEAERLQKEAEEAAAMKEAEAQRKAEERKAKAAAARAAARAEKEAAEKAAAAPAPAEKKPAPKKKTEPVAAPVAKKPVEKKPAPTPVKAEPAPAPKEEEKPVEKKGGFFGFFRRK